jgi:hypothetical protein
VKLAWQLAGDYPSRESLIAVLRLPFTDKGDVSQGEECSMEPRPTTTEEELATTGRQREEEAMRGSTYPPPDEATPPTPAPVEEPYPPDEFDVPTPDPGEDDDEDDT